MAGPQSASVVLALAVLAHEVGGAVAAVAVGPVNAAAAVLAGRRLAFVHVYLAVLTCGRMVVVVDRERERWRWLQGSRACAVMVIAGDDFRGKVRARYVL